MLNKDDILIVCALEIETQGQLEDYDILYTGVGKVNATFKLNDDSLKHKFDAMCHNAGISGLNGHRSVGGYRASMYNALELESVNILVEIMKTLEKNA